MLRNASATTNKTAGDSLVTVKELCKRTGITANKANDYISRRFLRVVQREGRTRLLQDPPASAIVEEIKEYLARHGNLNMCDTHLRERFPAYYG